MWRPLDKVCCSPCSVSISSPFADCKELTFTMLPPRFQESPLSLWNSVITEWFKGHNEHPVSHRKKSWDLPIVSSIAAELMATAPDALSKARLLSTCIKESGAWRHTLSVTSLVLHMITNIHIVIGLRLGAPICIPLLCHYCGSKVDTLGTHGLSCHFSAGCHFCHAMLIDILHRALSIASQLGPLVQMVSVLTVSPWFLGQMSDYWLGMQPV